MCGIIGVVTDLRAGLALSPAPILASLVAQNQDQALGDSLKSLEEGVQSLFSLGSIQALMTDAAQREALETLGQALLNRASEVEGRAKDRSQGAPSTEVQETLSAMAIRLKDMAWRIQKDLLPNSLRLAELAGGAPLSPHLLGELWKLNTLLGGLDRLEVRGRDSAGLGIAISFPSDDALSSFEAQLADLGLKENYEHRLNRAHLVAGAIAKSGPSLYFSMKVAREIGELGDNVTALRGQIRQDAILRQALSQGAVVSSPIAHTRWASNGVISEPNCHPLVNLTAKAPLINQGPRPLIAAALNGDIDNFMALTSRLKSEDRVQFPQEITTDAQVIPLWIEHYLRGGLTFEEAFRRAVGDFEGSMAISVTTTSEPGRVYLALKGSGQSVYVGRTEGGYLYASELYGIVEETSTFWKMDGERPRVEGDLSTIGQVFILDPATDQKPCALRGMWLNGEPLTLKKTGSKAEITTRDIDRAGYPHFLLKEISEAIHSVRKTLRGKYLREGGKTTFPFLTDTVPEEILKDLRSGTITRLLCIGQGTAAIAAQGISNIMGRLMREGSLKILSMKATELSGFYLRDSMADTLILAVSQSGTTTDTNRTVDMAKDRGARVLAIVNRRNSDLVYKADAVLYTSDGRDVEMSVASTKAFYAQISAGYLLGLALAQHLQALPPPTLEAELDGLISLPDLIGQVVSRPEPIEALANAHAVRHRHWAVVGSGDNFVAAQEIRIKLSELCYKAIPVDFTEDKKHIDLSSEPLILVCAAGQASDIVSDVVKEVAIFKAHKASPVVIATEGERGFDPYALGVLKVPKASPGVAFVLSTVVGHLWSYYAAKAIDAQAQALRQLRAQSTEVLERLLSQDASIEALLEGLRRAVAEKAAVIEAWLRDGTLNSGLTASKAVNLAQILKVLRGRISLDDLYLDLGAAATTSTEALGALIVETLTHAIDALTRPIDAIKHQAKTVTVGISRSEAPKGPIFEAIRALGVTADQLLPTHIQSLRALSPLVEGISGSVLYKIGSLDPTGVPGPGTTIRVERKMGLAQGMSSRLEGGGPLKGTKHSIVAGRRLFVGVGSYDGRPLVMFPLFAGSQTSGLALLHARFRDDAGREAKAKALKAYKGRYGQIIDLFAEKNIPWAEAYLDDIGPAALFEGSLEIFFKGLS